MIHQAPPENDELTVLENWAATHPNQLIRRRVDGVLRLIRGQSGPQVAKALRVTANTVYRWQALWRSQGVAGLLLATKEPHRASGGQKRQRTSSPAVSVGMTSSPPVLPLRRLLAKLGKLQESTSKNIGLNYLVMATNRQEWTLLLIQVERLIMTDGQQRATGTFLGAIDLDGQIRWEVQSGNLRRLHLCRFIEETARSLPRPVVVIVEPLQPRLRPLAAQEHEWARRGLHLYVLPEAITADPENLSLETLASVPLSPGSTTSL